MTPLPSPTLPLPMAGEGIAVRAAGIGGGQRAAHRLAEISPTPGVALSILHDGGTLLVAVGDARLALGAGVAHTVLVRLIERSASYG